MQEHQMLIGRKEKPKGENRLAPAISVFWLRRNQEATIRRRKKEKLETISFIINTHVTVGKIRERLSDLVSFLLKGWATSGHVAPNRERAEKASDLRGLGGNNEIKCDRSSVLIDDL
jgi:hypothetical protein